MCRKSIAIGSLLQLFASHSEERRSCELPPPRASEAPFVYLLLLVVAGAPMAGCGQKGSELVAVSGQVTMDGEPVGEGQIQFFPDSGRPASGELGPDGRYQLTTYEAGDGVLPGAYKVTVTAVKTHDPREKFASFEEEREYYTQLDAQAPVAETTTQVEWLVPELYSRRDSSPLQANVNRDERVIDFALQSSL